MVLGRGGLTPCKWALQSWSAGTALPRWVLGVGCLTGIGGSSPSLSKPLAVATPYGLAWNCTLGVEGPSLSLLAFFLPFILCCCLSSVLLFLPFPLYRLSFAVGEADPFAPGKALCRAGRNVVSSRRKSMLWGMALASQPEPASCVSGHRKRAFPQGASLSPEVTGGGSAWGRREQACWGRLAVPGGAEAVETGPGSWGMGCPLGPRGPGKDRQRLAGGLRSSQPAGGWGCAMEARQQWI